ncbi:LacI family DNA-binding transcriptional regulator [Allonocardiopsis opalescens]|uniref:LacI family transcriptional regulator n=1 Tax=Allonocardiopsis opalescens TaxID=1144618 RepID=A0A2T0PS72_9ACTN|nr:LacI family transcriptional regulator [Allonocardiopsis opalescens]
MNVVDTGARDQRSKRPTITDIARRAGVSKGTVSYALNDQPGVAAATRNRIREIALELGWQPNSAARALSGARAGVVGLVLARSADLLEVEPFFMSLISGFELRFGPREVSLLLQVIGEDPEQELAIYRRWAGQRKVDGVVLADLRTGDPRPALLSELGLPAVVLARHDELPGIASVWVDERVGMREAVEYLAALGHRSIARVTGIPDFVHTRARTDTFLTVAGELGMAARCVEADYTGAAGARATRRLLTAADRPSAIIYDNDVMAVAGLGVAQELGVRVPGDVSFVAWDDSPWCRLTYPTLSVVHHDVVAFGAAAAGALLRLIAGEEVPPQRFVTHLEPRASTARLGPPPS